MDLVVVVDVANVVGSRPDGWWRDRLGAAERLLARFPDLVGRIVPAPSGAPVTIVDVLAVVEGRAARAEGPEGITVIRADGEGDTTIAAEATRLAGAGTDVLVVTADRGLRARLPERAEVAGPRWLNDLIGR